MGKFHAKIEGILNCIKVTPNNLENMEYQKAYIMHLRS